jgi:Outer membrane protein beta-barrel domain
LAEFFRPDGFLVVMGMLKRAAICSKSYSLPVLKETHKTSMKKLIVCILCLASTTLFAQVQLGVQGSFSSLNFWQTDGIGGLPTLAYTRQMNGYQAGLFADIDLGHSGFLLQPALMYAENGTNLRNTQGFVETGGYQIGESDTYIRIYSLRVPVNLVYKYEITSKWKVFAGLGPYVAKTLNGTEKGWYSQINSTTYAETFPPINNTIKISGDASYNIGGASNVPAFDFGMDFLLGFSYKKLDISASFNRGFTTIYHTRYANFGNQFWNFTVGYTIFGHPRKPKL